jgi:glycosyl transferase family 2
MSSPLVSVLMAVHNGADYVDAAVESILRQRFTDFEFLIVDDGSTDDTPQRLARFTDPRIRRVRNEANLGLARSLNRGLALARGALIARQDADDVSHVSRLGEQVAFLEREPGVAVLGTQVRYIDARGRPVSVAPWPKSTSALAIRWQLLFDGPFVHASVMFRRAIVWTALGGYDESFATSQDFELWSRVGAGGHAMRNLPATLVDFRIHPASASARYTVEGVSKVAPVVRRNVIAELGLDALPSDWPDAWIRLTNPAVFRDAGDDWATVARAIHEIHCAFTAKHPEAAGHEEIRRHLASLLIRLSCWGAERRRPKSMSAFAQACRLEPGMAARALPRYIGSWTIGRRRGRARPSTQASRS